jgi:acetyl esterase/lipase
MQVPLRWPTTEGHGSSNDGSAVVYLHGDGMILGSVQASDRYVAGHVAESGVPVLSVDYRRAPEDPYPTPVEDCFAALAWLAAHADELFVNAARIAFMGDSGGGGLAAATALMARDRELTVAKQILIYPMLDDRTTTPDPMLEPFAFSTYDNNYTDWTRCSVTLSEHPRFLRPPLRRAPEISLDLPAPTSRLAIWTSSATNASTMPDAWPRRAPLSSSTSTRDAHMDSTVSIRPSQLSNAPALTVSGSCARCDPLTLGPGPHRVQPNL